MWQCKKATSFLCASICLAMAFCLNSCIEDFTPDIENDTGLLVVEGLITDAPGPYEVRLSRSAPLETFELIVEPEAGARVSIIDGDGNETFLAEDGTEPGLYATDPNAVRGEVGQTYELLIETRNGRRYRSRPETILPVPEIAELYFEVEEKRMIVQDSEGDFREEIRNGIQVYIDLSSSSNEATKLRWDWEETYEIREFDIRNDISSDARVDVLPEINPDDPYPPFLPPADTCFVTNPSFFYLNVAQVESAQRQLNRHPIEFIFQRNKLGVKYSILVKQLSLTDSAHRYWNLVNEQIEADGFLFGPTPAQIEGNLFSESSVDEEVLGYFGASGQQERRLVIDAAELPEDLDMFDVCNEKKISPATAEMIEEIRLGFPPCFNACLPISVYELMMERELIGSCFDCTKSGLENTSERPDFLR